MVKKVRVTEAHLSALVARLDRVPPEDQSTSSVPLGELLYGAHRSSRTRHYGELRAELGRRGTSIGDADTHVASIALSRDSRW